MADPTDIAARPRRQCDITREANAKARRTRVCEQCGVSFVMRSPSGKARRGEVQEGRFCSRACSAETVRIYATEAEAQRAAIARKRERAGLPPIGHERPCDICGSSFPITSVRSRLCSDACRAEDSRVSSLASNQRRDERDRSLRPCRGCGAIFAPEYGDKRSAFCSSACREALEDRIKRGVNRARAAGCKTEPIDPLVVLNRGGWRCYLCGEETPQSLRGTWDPRAPEVDHIIPLAAGGDHSYANTACACRECNHAKGASEGSDQEWFRRPSIPL